MKRILALAALCAALAACSSTTGATKTVTVSGPTVTAAAAAPVTVTVTATSKAAPASSVDAAPSGDISQGFGSKDASGDVKLGKLAPYDIGGTVMYYKVPVTVTNSTKERGDYVIDLALESADGKQQYDTATVLVTNLEGGQVKADEGDFMQTDKLPAGAKVVIQTVQRTASF